MSLDMKFYNAREAFFAGIETVNMEIAKFFGYPENPGMPVTCPYDFNFIVPYLKDDYIPRHSVPFPPKGIPQNYKDIIIGIFPRVSEIPRTFYHSKETGFYSFYIQEFRNIIFLPDQLSEYLQINFNNCLDISWLEAVRQGLFMGVVFYALIVHIRSLIFWFCDVNPYDGIIYYLVALVDWFEESFGGYIPNLFGVNMSLTVFQYLIGKFGDCFNHIVFTMPYLPSEAYKDKFYIDESLENILDFKYLPYLWYKYPIPNEVRQYWILKRPDILTYMQKSYSQLDIDLLPDAVLKYAHDNPKLRIESIPFQSLSSKLAAHLQTISFIGSPLDIDSPDPGILDYFTVLKDTLYIFFKGLLIF